MSASAEEDVRQTAQDSPSAEVIVDNTEFPQYNTSENLNRVLHLAVHPAYGLEIQRSSVIKKFILRCIPLHAFKHLRAELRLFLISFRSSQVRRRYKNSDNMLVNVGLGAPGKVGWVNVDALNAPSVLLL